MLKWKTLAAFALAVSAYAANPFSDVPRTHWAYEAIQRAVDTGILQGYDGKFHGDKLVNRYQMAVIIKKILDNVGKGSGGGTMKPTDIKNLEQLTIEFADELALLNTKVSTLEDSFVQLRGEVDKMKGGSTGASGGAGGLTQAFTGIVSVALVSTDDGVPVAPAVPPAGAIPLTRYNGNAPPILDQLFFTIPQASIALDKEVGEGIGLHVQYDYGSDALNGGAVVGLNEAYLLVDELFGDIGAKIGGFALPFQSWEVNGAFRTCNYTITPSAINSAFEAIRPIGIEVQRLKDVDPSDFQWRFAIFTGSDFPIGTVPGIGPMSDAAGIRALGGSATFDDQIGYYLDLESGNDPDKSWGWRLGFFDLGGDAPGAVAPPAGAPAPSHEIDGFNIGFWWKNEDFKVIFQFASADNEFAAGPGGTNDADAWYILLNYQFNEDNSVSLRYDDWENELNTPGIATGLEGDAFTLAWNRKTSDTSMFQFEYVSPDEEPIGVAPVGTSDIDDDLLQFRYKVWF